MKVINCVQGSEAWRDARRGRATASKFSSFITDKKAEFSERGARTYAYELLAERIVPPHYWLGKDYESSAMANGTLTEREARSYFEFTTGLEVKQVGFITTDDGFAGASPDGLVGEAEDDPGLELKCPTHATQVKYLLNPEELICEYRAQCAGGMLIAQRKRWFLMSYAVGLPPVIHEFKLDDYTLKVAECLNKFRLMYDEMAVKLTDLGDPVAAIRSHEESYF